MTPGDLCANIVACFGGSLLSKKLQEGLSKRERQIMNVVYREKRASVRVVLGQLSNPPSYSAVRATMNNLVGKGFLSREKEDKKYIYLPTIPHLKAKTSAIRHLLETYFNDSVGDAVTALLKGYGNRLSDEEYHELRNMLEKEANRK